MMLLKKNFTIFIKHVLHFAEMTFVNRRQMSLINYKEQLWDVCVQHYGVQSYFIKAAGTVRPTKFL
jgi:hypothetical protein